MSVTVGRFQRLELHRADIAADIMREIRDDPYLRGLGLDTFPNGMDLEVPAAGVQAYWCTIGGHVDRSRLAGRAKVKIPRDLLAIAVEIPAEEADGVGTRQQLVDEGSFAMRRAIAGRIQQIHQQAGPNASLLVAAFWPGMRSSHLWDAGGIAVFELSVQFAAAKV